MNLYELPDKEFDSLFKKAADSAEFPFNESAWEGFKEKLNRWEKFSPAFWRISGGLIIVLLGMVSYLILKSPETGKSETQKIQIGNPENIILKDRTPIDNRLEMDESTEDMKAGSGKSSEPQNKNLKKDKTGVAVINNSQVHPVNDEGSELLNIRRKQTMYYVEIDEKRESVVDNRGDQKLRDGRLIGMGLPESTGNIPENLILEKNSSNLEIIPPEKNSTRIGYSLNFTVGPDFSGVGANSYGTGTFIGLGFELFFLKKVSLLVGVSHSRKKYSVRDEYSVPFPGSGTYGQVPDQIDIACHVLDIPLNIYYSLYQNGKNRLFAGMGVSSYLMLTEEYHFNFDNPYNMNVIPDFEIRNKNQHYFGIINLSAGYSRQMNDRLAWQLEPYFKLPIQDIAAAKVRLNSFGALISLKYRFR